QLLVEVEEAAQPADCREASVNLLVGRQHAVEYVADPVAGVGNGAVHDQSCGTAHSCNSGATKVSENARIAFTVAPTREALPCCIARSARICQAPPAIVPPSCPTAAPPC